MGANLLSIGHTLERDWCTPLPVRDTAPEDSVLRDLLEPRKPSTAERHFRMWLRYQSFLDGDRVAYSNLGCFHRQRVLRWFRELQDSRSGAHTLQSGLAMIGFVQGLFELPDSLDGCHLLRRMARNWRDSQKGEPNRAKPMDKRMIAWLERLVLSDRPPADRLVAGRMRLAVGASIRNDDMRKTPIGRSELILTQDGTIRAMRTRAAETKTQARFWICSALAVTAENDGWLGAVVELLEAAHGSLSSLDDHLGKACARDRKRWLANPPDAVSDAAHIRILMSEETTWFGDRQGFTAKEIADFRVHGCKPTLISAGIHMQQSENNGHDGTTAIRHQGGWRGKSEETMPDTYLRESQLLALNFQERVLSWLRGGGEVACLDSVVLASVGPPPHADSRLTTAGPHRIWWRPNPDAGGLRSPPGADVESTVSDTASSGSDSSTSESADEPELAVQLLLTTSSQCLHQAAIVTHGPPWAVGMRGWSPLCGRRVLKFSIFNDTASEAVPENHHACVLCFPRPAHRSLDECQAICAFKCEGGFCRRLCVQRDPPHVARGAHGCLEHMPDFAGFAEFSPALTDIVSVSPEPAQSSTQSSESEPDNSIHNGAALDLAELPRLVCSPLSFSPAGATPRLEDVLSAQDDSPAGLST